MIPPASSVPANFSAKCSDHLTVRYRKKTHGKRRLRRNDSEEEESSEEEEEDSDEELEENDSEEEEEEDESEDERQKIIRKKSIKSKSSPVIPTKRRASPQSLFPEDQQSSDDNLGDRKDNREQNEEEEDDDDDDMGTSSSKPKLNLFGNKSSHHNINSMHTTPSYKERLEAKRKKSAMDTRIVEDRRPLATPPLNVTPKQKLPNRAHLTNSSNISTTNTANTTRPGSTPPTLTKRFSTGPGIIKSIDEVRKFNFSQFNQLIHFLYSFNVGLHLLLIILRFNILNPLHLMLSLLPHFLKTKSEIQGNDKKTQSAFRRRTNPHFFFFF